MKLILSKDGVKRELHTPFAVCTSPDDLERIGREFIALAAGMRADNASYGWQRVDPSHPCDCPPNTPPLLWTDREPITADVSGAEIMAVTEAVHASARAYVSCVTNDICKSLPCACARDIAAAALDASARFKADDNSAGKNARSNDDGTKTQSSPEPNPSTRSAS
jgi:hypothetical protein